VSRADPPAVAGTQDWLAWEAKLLRLPKEHPRAKRQSPFRRLRALVNEERTMGHSFIGNEAPFCPPCKRAYEDTDEEHTTEALTLEGSFDPVRMVDWREQHQNLSEPVHFDSVHFHMYVRFVVPSLGRNAWGLMGLIRASSDLMGDEYFSHIQEASLNSIWEWFNRQLPIPRRFSRSRRSGAANNAVCWFKPTAMECVRKARELAKMLEASGVHTAMLRTRKPGYVVYEDRLQIVAEPFHDTFNRQK